MKTKNKISFSCGQALTEVLVSMLFFAPIFLLMPVIAKHLDIKQKIIEASRYAVWERSVWSDSGNWKNKENEKSDETIAIEVDRRFFGHPSQLISRHSAFSHKDVVENPMWSTTNPTIEIYSKNKQSNNAASPPSTVPIFNGVKMGNKTLRAYTEVTENRAPISLFGIDQIAEQMEVKAKDYAIATVSTPVKNYFDSDDKLIIQAKSALLTNTWAAGEESIFKERVDHLVLDEAVDGLVKTGYAAAAGGYIAVMLYWPDLDNMDADASVDSTVLPEHLLRKQAAPDEDKEANNGTSQNNGNSAYDSNAAAENTTELNTIEGDINQNNIDAGSKESGLSIPTEADREDLENQADTEVQTATQNNGNVNLGEAATIEAGLTDEQTQELDEERQNLPNEIDGATGGELSEDDRQILEDRFNPPSTQEDP